MHFQNLRLLPFKVRKSFFNDLGIQNNVSIVDLLYEQFYTGSDTEPSQEEKDFMKVTLKDNS